MKTLIINGSPNKDGNTSYIVNLLKGRIPGKIQEIRPYFEKISPCIDCRFCWHNHGCAINDKMSEIYEDDYDILIIASPVYMYNVTPPVFSIITRLNCIWSNQFFLKEEINYKSKKGILVLVGGGSGEPKHALDMAKLTFKSLNAKFDEKEDYIYSLNTNKILAKDDKHLEKQIERVISKIH